MNQLTEQLRAADRVCQQAFPYFEQAETIRVNAETKITKSRKQKKTWKIVSALAIITILPSFITTPLVAILGEFGGFVALPVIFAAGFLLYTRIVNPLIERNAQRNENTYAASVAEADELEKNGLAVLAEDPSVLTVIPEEYRYPMATSYLLNIVETGRTDNINQALQMYDEQLHP